MKGAPGCLLCACGCGCGRPLGKMIGELGDETALPEGSSTLEGRAPPVARVLRPPPPSLDRGTSCPVAEFMAKGNNTSGLVDTAM